MPGLFSISPQIATWHVAPLLPGNASHSHAALFCTMMPVLKWYQIPGTCACMASNGRNKLVTAHVFKNALVLWTWDENSGNLEPLHKYYGEPFPDTQYPDGIEVAARTRFHFADTLRTVITVAFCAGTDMVLVCDSAVSDVHIVDIVRRKHCGFLDLDLSRGQTVDWLTTALEAPIGIVTTKRFSVSQHPEYVLHVIDTNAMRVRFRVAMEDGSHILLMKLSDDGTQLCINIFGGGLQVLDLSGTAALSDATIKVSDLPVLATYDVSSFHRDIGVWRGAWFAPCKHRNQNYFQFFQDSVTTKVAMDMSAAQTSDLEQHMLCMESLCPMLDGRIMLGLLQTLTPAACVVFFHVSAIRTAWVAACVKTALHKPIPKTCCGLAD